MNEYGDYEVEDTRLYNGDQVAGAAQRATALIRARLDPDGHSGAGEIVFLTACAIRELLNNPEADLDDILGGWLGDDRADALMAEYGVE